MLIYLASNSCLDVDFSIHQCESLTHVPCQAHARLVKSIFCYIKVTEDKGLILEPYQNIQVDCYVDSDFFGLWGVEEDQKTLCVKSLTGFIIMFMGYPLTWVSKLKYKIYLITMES